MTTGANHFVGVACGLLLIAVVWYLYWNDECPPKHTGITFLIGMAMIGLSSDLIVPADVAAGYDIIAYIVLTFVGFLLAFRGWMTVGLADSDIDIESELLSEK